jgi:hypothetical protein
MKDWTGLPVNRFLEKIALNRFEKHLISKPQGKVFSDPKVQVAYNNVQDYKSKRNDAVKSVQSGISDNEFTDKIQGAQDSLRKNRRPLTGAGLGGPFMKQNPRLKNPPLNVRLGNFKANKQVLKNNKFYNRAFKFVKTHPIGLGLGVATAALGAYGLKKSTEN